MPERKRRLSVGVLAFALLLVTPLVVGASDSFTDVPDSNVHHDDITWLRDAGVTLGCNPPANTEFCPGDAVLRQQMASFLRRLAENQVVDAATAVTAESAATADSINGVTVERFFFQTGPNTSGVPIGDFGPLTLLAACDGAGEPTLQAQWSEDVNHMTFEGSTGALFGNATVTAGTMISIGGGQFGSVGLAEAVGFDSNFHTSIEYFLRDSPALGDAMCFFSGFVTIG